MENEQRISSYVIPVGVTADKYMLMHGYCGSVDVIEKNAWDNLKIGLFNKISNDKGLIEYLIKRDYVTNILY